MGLGLRAEMSYRASAIDPWEVGQGATRAVEDGDDRAKGGTEVKGTPDHRGGIRRHCGGEREKERRGELWVAAEREDPQTASCVRRDLSISVCNFIVG